MSVNIPRDHSAASASTASTLVPLIPHELKTADFPPTLPSVLYPINVAPTMASLVVRIIPARVNSYVGLIWCSQEPQRLAQYCSSRWTLHALELLLCTCSHDIHF